jgi:hypothetical protein
MTMNDRSGPGDRIARLARGLPYPATPDLAGQVSARLVNGGSRFRPLSVPLWLAATIVLFVGGMLAVPPVRAFVFELIGIGAVRFETGEAGASPERQPVATVGLAALPSDRISLSEARELTGQPLALPTWPDGIGDPDAVLHLNLVDGWVAFMLWTAPEARDRARFSLAAIRTSAAVGKSNPDAIVQTTVHGQPALWTRGAHTLMLPLAVDDWVPASILVDANVLIWESGDITWRLESGLGLEDMRRIAESIPD